MPGAFLLQTQQRASMAAHIVKSIHLVCILENHDDQFLTDFVAKILPLLRNAADVVYE